MDDRELTDDELIRAARDGQGGAVDELMARYRGCVKSRARSFFLAGSEPEDLVQEGMIGLYKAIRDYSPEKAASFKSFARLCINRQILTAIKAANRDKHKPLNNYLSLSPQADADGDSEAGRGLIDTSADNNPEEAVLNKELREQFYRRANDVLSYFEAGVLGDYLRGLSYQEIAAQRKISAKSVDNALQRIRKKLQKAADDLF